MTKREMNAKIKAVEEEMAEMKKHRKPSDKEDDLAIESMSIQQQDRESNKALEVSNSHDVVTELSEASVKTAPGGYDEVKQSQNTNKDRSQGVDRD